MTVEKGKYKKKYICLGLYSHFLTSKMFQLLVVLACGCIFQGVSPNSHGLMNSHPFLTQFKSSSPIAMVSEETKPHTNKAKHLPVYLMNRVDSKTESKNQKEREEPARDITHNLSILSGTGNNTYQAMEHHQGCNTVSTRLQANIAPLPLPGPKTCKTPLGPRASKETGEAKDYLPPNSCDLCPKTENNLNPLDPCMCIGNNETSAGMISITCPPTMATLEQLESILNTPDYITTDVFRFTLKGSMVGGVMTQDLWGDLAFHQVVIEGNHFTQVDYNTFKQSEETLSYISLFNNEITNFVTFADLPKLRSLILKRNNISVIFSSAYSYSSLRQLDLSYNMIYTIGNDAFAGLDKLELLILSHNKLAKIEDETFKFFNHNPDSNFLDIDLSYNEIEFIEDNAFPKLANARIILEGNKLTTISEKVFKPIIVDSSNFALFVFEGNEVVCDCNILWVIEDPFTLSCFDDFMCANIPKTLYVLTAQDLNCTLN